MKNAYWLAVGACVAIAGCGGKADITSDCSLKDTGEVHCTFKNKGNAKGTLCEHIVLLKKPELLSQEQAAKSRYNENWQQILAMIAQQGKNAKAHTAKSAKEEAKTRGVSLDKVIEERRAELASLAENDNSYISAEEICSGLVDASGAREVNGKATFTGKPPQALCAFTPEGSWTEGCNFKTISVDELHRSIKQAIETTPDK